MQKKKLRQKNPKDFLTLLDFERTLGTWELKPWVGSEKYPWRQNSQKAVN